MLVTMTVPPGVNFQNTIPAAPDGAPDLNTQFFVNPAETANPVLYSTTDLSAGVFSASLRDAATLYLNKLQQVGYAQQLETEFSNLTFSVSTFNWYVNNSSSPVGEAVGVSETQKPKLAGSSFTEAGSHRDTELTQLLAA